MPTKTPTRGAARKRRHRKPMTHEAMEPQGHESTESPEDETREGTEDSEGCCNAKAGKPKCSACASGKPCSGGRGDGLTSQDYLLACDLGIQDRPTPYIRGRLDAMATRNDLRPTGGKGKKCGNSYIPASATCNNGQGGSRLRRGLETAGRVGGAAAYGLGVGQAVRSGLKGNFTGAARGIALANAGSGVYGAAQWSKGKRTGDDKLKQRGQAQMAMGLYGTGLGLAASGDLGRGVRAARSAASRGMSRMRPATSSALAPYTGGSRTNATRAGSIGNRMRRASNAAFGNTASGRQARQGMRNSMNSAVFSTRRGSSFTAAGSLGNRARRAAYGARTYGAGIASTAASAGSMARQGASSYWNRRRKGTSIVPYGRRDSIWADGFEMEMV